MKRLFLLLLAINLGISLWGYQQEQVQLRAAPAPRADVGDLYLLSELESNPALVPYAVGVAVLEAERPYLPEQEEDQSQQDESIVAMPMPAIDEEHIGALLEEEFVEAALVNLTNGEQFAAEDKETELLIAMQPPMVNEKSSEEQRLEQSARNLLRDDQIVMEINEIADTALQQDVIDEVAAKEVQSAIGSQAEIEMLPPDGTQEESVLEKQLAYEGEEVAELIIPENITHIKMVTGSEEFVLEKKCYRLGPIDKHFAATVLIKQLAHLNVEATSHEVPVRRHVGYWVVYPPLDTIAQTREKMQELKVAGITDIWRFPQGEFRNAISLGLFSRMENAEGVRESALEKGFVTEVFSRYEEGLQYWLEFQSADEPPLTEESLQELQDGYIGPELALRPCPAVVIP